MKPAARKELFARLAELNPDPTTELVYGTPFELLIAVILWRPQGLLGTPRVEIV